MRTIAEQTRTCAPAAVELFQYPGDEAIVADWEGFAEPAEPDTPKAPQKSAQDSRGAEVPAEVDRRLNEERRCAFEAGREKGCEEGRVLEREAQISRAADAEKQRIAQAAATVEGFRQERERYFEEVEREVVGLALAIAARVLRREAQMDPLLLTGAVRVALGQLAATTTVRLKVPPTEVELWAENLSLLPNLPIKPEVIPGEGMQLGECLIETEMGTVDLGIRAQLGEIESGLFDRGGRSVAEEKMSQKPDREAEILS